MGEQVFTTRTGFQADLSQLRDTVVQLGAFAESMLARSAQALTTQDHALAEEVRRSDHVANSLNYETAESALRLLALQHPVATDLRTVIAAIRIAVDLERVADYSKDIAKVARRLSSQAYHWELEDIPLMAQRAQEMLRLALHAFTEGDVATARRVAGQDEELDNLWRVIRGQCMDHMREDPSFVEQATYFLLVARYLERIGDHIVNVAEHAAYVQSGRLEPLV
jgi:phosphate transport system protein